jgi:hypothetical protein
MTKQPKSLAVLPAQYVSEVRDLVFGDRDLGVELTFVFSWMLGSDTSGDVRDPKSWGMARYPQIKYKFDESNRTIQRLQNKVHLHICAPP